MRLSVVVGDKTDAKDFSNYDVYLDGQKQKICVIADEELGMVRRYKLNKLGLLARGRHGLITEDIKGDVRILKKKKHTIILDELTKG